MNASTEYLGRPQRPMIVNLSDKLFWTSIIIICGVYCLLILMLVIGDIVYMVQSSQPAVAEAGSGAWLFENPIVQALREVEIRNSIILSMISCTLSAFISIGIAIPIGYIMCRAKIPGISLIDAILDIPIVLPPLVVGLSLLILFQFNFFTMQLGDILPFETAWDDYSLNSLVVYQVPSVILAQFVVAAAFSIRTMKAAFQQVDKRREEVALTLGCTRFQAFNRVVLPEVAPGIVTAWTIAWARSLGEFGPLLIFAGATRNKTEVLSTTVFLELSIGNLIHNQAI